jgi:hypothetical protein
MGIDTLFIIPNQSISNLNEIQEISEMNESAELPAFFLFLDQ